MGVDSVTLADAVQSLNLREGENKEVAVPTSVSMNYNLIPPIVCSRLPLHRNVYASLNRVLTAEWGRWQNVVVRTPEWHKCHSRLPFLIRFSSHFSFRFSEKWNQKRARNNMKNDPKNVIFQKQLSCLFLMRFCFSFIFHPFFVFRFEVAEGRFSVVHSFSSFLIWQLHHSIHWSHYLMRKKIKIRHF